MAKVKIPVADIVAAFGGKENIAQATHCATRLRVTPKDASKADIAGMKKIPGVLGVVEGASQIQVIIGAEVSNVYREFISLTGVAEEAAVDENLDSQDLKETLKNKKGGLLTSYGQLRQGS